MENCHGTAARAAETRSRPTPPLTLGILRPHVVPMVERHGTRYDALSRLLSPRAEGVYTLLRFLAGLMLSFHGMQKLFGILSGFQPPPGSQLWFGGIIELVAGLSIAVGAWATYAALVASATMAVAYVQFHWKLDFGTQFFPAINKGELALLYSLVFLFIACRGAGRWSVDGLRGQA